MFGLIILDMRTATLAVLAAAFLEAVGLLLLSRWVSWCLPGGSRRLFIGQRISLAIIFTGGVVVYSSLKNFYRYDPFFYSLYVFIVAFFLFYYLTGLAAVLSALAVGGEARIQASPVPYLMSSLVLLLVVVAKPQISLFGFFCGCAAHLADRLGEVRRPRGKTKLWLTIGVGFILFLFLTLLSR